VPIVFQKSQKARRLIFRQRTKQAKIADQCGLKPATGIACEFGVWGRGPPTSFFNCRAYGSENLSPVPQKDFCNTIGTKLPIRDVRSSVAVEDRPDMPRKRVGRIAIRRYESRRWRMTPSLRNYRRITIRPADLAVLFVR